MSDANDVVFLSGRRTPFGTLGGALKSLSATDLGVATATAAIEQAQISAEAIEHVIYGNVMQTSADAIYLARHIGLRAGAGVQVPALTVNRLCGSGFEAFAQAALLLKSGRAKVVLAGGTESMSQAPHVIRGARVGLALGKGQLEDTLIAALYDTYAELPMGMTAENLAVQYQLTQQQVDEYSVLSQQRHAAAQAAGRFADELMKVELKSKQGVTYFERDEHPRPDSTVAGFARLPKVFKKDGVIHPGAASGINDGAASAVLSTRAWAEAQGKRPLGRLVDFAAVGCDPKVMGIGPAPAIRALLGRAGLSLADIDLFEVNEAFAPQYLAVEKELGLPREKTNVNGGAIAVGHPLGASGARITLHLLYELRRRGGRLAVGSACIGGGQGIAVLLEAM